MNKAMKSKLFWFLQPLLVMVYPILHIYSLNTKYVSPLHIAFAIANIVIITAILFTIFKIFYKTYPKTSFFLSTSVLIFYLLHFVIKYLLVPISMHTKVIRVSYILAPLLFLLAYFAIALRHTKIKTALLQIYFLPFIALSGFTLLQITSTTINRNIAIKKYEKWNSSFKKILYRHAKKLAKHNLPKNKPDIYFILLDSYSSNKQLSKTWGYNNSKFTNKLKKMGFSVLEESLSNYPITEFSLPPTLNMRYFPENISPLPNRHIWNNNNSYHFFKEIGYSIIDLGFDMRNSSVNAFTFNDKNIIRYLFAELVDFYLGSLNFVRTVLQENAILSPLLMRFLNNRSYEYMRKATKAKLHILKTLYQQEGPKFVYAHFLCPHPPHLWDKDGLPIMYSDNSTNEIIKYIHSVQFINKQVLNVVKTIFRESKKKPIIIIQADHSGFYTYAIETNSKEHIINPKLTYEILNAFYLPQNKTKEPIPSNMSPINNFRFVIDHYFNGNLGLLENKFFSNENHKNPTFVELEK